MNRNILLKNIFYLIDAPFYKWSMKLIFILLILLSFLIYFLVNSYLISNIKIKFQENLNKEKLLLSKLESDYLNIISTEHIKKLSSYLRKLITNSNKKIISNDSLSILIDNISKIAINSGLNLELLERVDIKSNKVSSDYTSLNYKLILSGNYYQIGEFFSKINSGNILISFYNYSIIANSKLGYLQLYIIFKTYLYV